jgi:hypothetical protein
MKRKEKKVDTIPYEFSSYEEAGKFWDTHDTTDYLDEFFDTEVDVQLQGRKFEIDIDEDVMELLNSEARRTHVPPGQIANQLLRKDLTMIHS